MQNPEDAIAFLKLHALGTNAFVLRSDSQYFAALRWNGHAWEYEYGEKMGEPWEQHDEQPSDAEVFELLRERYGRNLDDSGVLAGFFADTWVQFWLSHKQ
jgi:hypothetical protein